MKKINHESFTRYEMTKEEAATLMMEKHHIVDTRYRTICRGSYDSLIVRFADESSTTTYDIPKEELISLIAEKHNIQDKIKTNVIVFMIIGELSLYVHDKKKSWLQRIFKC
jgi:hypothetical protein